MAKFPKAILFDWDNTLVDTWPLIHNALVATFEAMGQEPWVFEETRRRVKRSMREAFPGLFGERWEEAAAVYQAHYVTHHLRDLRPLPQALELLDFLAGKPVYLAVVSNKKSVNLRKEADHLGLSSRFSALVGADDAAHDKPHPDPALLAVRDSGITLGQDVWFVGDTAIDLECALNTGCVPVLYGDAPIEQTPQGPAVEGFGFSRHYPDHAHMIDALKALKR